MTFTIDALSVRRGRIGICPVPGRFGMLEQDLDQLAAWSPNIVVSMTEAEEMVAAGCPDLGAFLAEQGIAWTHLPIRDYGGPDGASADVWHDVQRDLTERLHAGQSLLLHCRGGQGRSGMIALRLMVAMGEGPAEALQRLRQARPGAVETDEQLTWAQGSY